MTEIKRDAKSKSENHYEEHLLRRDQSSWRGRIPVWRAGIEMYTVAPFASHQGLSCLPFLWRRAGQLASGPVAIHASAAAHPGQVICSTQAPWLPIVSLTLSKLWIEDEVKMKVSECCMEIQTQNKQVK